MSVHPAYKSESKQMPLPTVMDPEQF